MYMYFKTKMYRLYRIIIIYGHFTILSVCVLDIFQLHHILSNVKMNSAI